MEVTIVNWLLVVLSSIALFLKSIEAIQNWKSFSPPLKRSLLGNILVGTAICYAAIKGLFLATVPTEVTVILAVGVFLWILAFLGEKYPHLNQQKRQGDDNTGVGTWIKNNVQI